MAYYGVWQGRNIGIYSNWDECKAQVDGYKGAKYKKLKAINEQEAKIEFFAEMKNVQSNENNKTTTISNIPNISLSSETTKVKSWPKDYPEKDYLTVDGAAEGQKNCEYQAVFLKSKKVAFKSKLYQGGTNNIAEFLGLVEAIKYIKENNIEPVVYTDSVTAMAWIRNGVANTTARETGKITDELEKLLQQAEGFLKSNNILVSKVEIRKWNTKDWGEIPADYGRK